jgi:superfamily II DNA or RNA helicase
VLQKKLPSSAPIIGCSRPNKSNDRRQFDTRRNTPNHRAFAIIVDECHHVAAKKFELIAKEVKARYVVGLSATPVRKDGHHPIIFMHCGPVRYRVSPKELAASRPFEHTIIIRHTQFKPINREEVNGRISIQDLYSALASDAARNDLIFDDVVAALEAGRSPLVITEGKDHLELLAERLSKFCKNVIELKGGMSSRGPKAAIAALESCGEDDERPVARYRPLPRRRL